MVEREKDNKNASRKEEENLRGEEGEIKKYLFSCVDNRVTMFIV